MRSHEAHKRQMGQICDVTQMVRWFRSIRQVICLRLASWVRCVPRVRWLRKVKCVKLIGAVRCVRWLKSVRWVRRIDESDGSDGSEW